MNGTNIIFQNASLEDIRLIIREELQVVLAAIKEEGKPQQPQSEYLTKKELREFLKVSTTTIWELTRKGKIKTYPVGGSVRYKRVEIENSIKKGIL